MMGIVGKRMEDGAFFCILAVAVTLPASGSWKQWDRTCTRIPTFLAFSGPRRRGGSGCICAPYRRLIDTWIREATGPSIQHLNTTKRGSSSESLGIGLTQLVHRRFTRLSERELVSAQACRCSPERQPQHQLTQ